MKSKPRHTRLLVPANFRRLTWEPGETGTIVGDVLYHLQACRSTVLRHHWVQQQCAACKKLVNLQPFRLECTFPGRKWLFPWKSQLPRVCMRSMEKVISSQYNSESVSTGLSYWLERKLNLCRFKVAFVNTYPSCTLLVGNTLVLDMVSPL